MLPNGEYGKWPHGEIDIMEFVEYMSDSVGSIHTGKFNHAIVERRKQRV